MKSLVYVEDGKICIHGTDPTHPYEVVFQNDAGVVGVKTPDAYGGEDTTRVRCVTWKAYKARALGTGEGDDYTDLITDGWEEKPGSTHVSVRLSGNSTCSCCGAAITDEEELARRIDQAIDFLSV